MHLHHINWLNVIPDIVVACSLLHTILPPWEFFDGFPTTQKYYKLIIYIISYIGLNGRSTVYPTISTNSGSALSQAAVQSPTSPLNNPNQGQGGSTKP